MRNEEYSITREVKAWETVSGVCLELPEVSCWVPGCLQRLHNSVKGRNCLLNPYRPLVNKYILSACSMAGAVLGVGVWAAVNRERSLPSWSSNLRAGQLVWEEPDIPGPVFHVQWIL